MIDYTPIASVTISRAEYSALKRMLGVLLMATVSNGGKLRIWKKTAKMYEGDRIRDIDFDLREDEANHCAMFLAWDRNEPDKELTCSQ